MSEGEFKKRVQTEKTDADNVWRQLQYGDDMIEVWQVNNLLDEACKDIFATFEVSHNNVKEYTPHLYNDLLIMDTRNAEFKLTELTRRLLKWFGEPKK